MSKTKRVGITGGIGAGKSIVCRIIHTLGYPVFYSDVEAKEILNTNADVIQSIIAVFGEEAYMDGQLNRSFIAKIVFNNQELLTKINSIVHPAVGAAFVNWAENQSAELVFNEAAILFETGGYKRNHANILVTADAETRIERVMKRDNLSREAVLNRMDKQWPDDKKEKLADYVVYNDNQHMLIPQVIELIAKLKNG